MWRLSSPGLFRTTTALMAWLGLGVQLYLLVANSPDNGLTVDQAIGRFFLYFTILSNLLVAFYTSFVNPGNSRPATATALAVYIFVVGLVYNVVLRQLWAPSGWQRLADELLHVIVPVFFIVYWFAFIPASNLKYRAALVWLIYPGAYLAYALIRGSVEHFYPYFFIDPRVVGNSGVVQNTLLLLVAFLGLGLGFVAVARIKKRPVPAKI